MVSQRCCQTATAALTSASASGAVRAAATARCAMPTWQTTLVSPTSPMSVMISAGPTTQPTRQPIIRSSFDAEPTVMVRLASAGWLAGCTGCRPSNLMRSMAAS